MEDQWRVANTCGKQELFFQRFGGEAEEEMDCEGEKKWKKKENEIQVENPNDMNEKGEEQ